MLCQWPYDGALSTSSWTCHNNGISALLIPLVCDLDVHLVLDHPIGYLWEDDGQDQQEVIGENWCLQEIQVVGHTRNPTFEVVAKTEDPKDQHVEGIRISSLQVKPPLDGKNITAILHNVVKLSFVNHFICNTFPNHWNSVRSHVAGRFKEKEWKCLVYMKMFRDFLNNFLLNIDRFLYIFHYCITTKWHNQNRHTNNVLSLTGQSWTYLRILLL